MFPFMDWMIKHLFVIYCIKNYFSTLVSFNYPTVDVIVSDSVSALVHEPADLTVHPPPELPRVGSFFSYRCLVFPKTCPQRKACAFRSYSG